MLLLVFYYYVLDDCCVLTCVSFSIMLLKSTFEHIPMYENSAI